MTDISYIWDYLSDFWSDAENKEIIEELWSGIAFLYKYLEYNAFILNNVIDLGNMVGTYTMDEGELEKSTGTDGGTANLGSIMSIDSMQLSGTSDIYIKDTDYTISGRTITYGNNMPDGVYITNNIKIDITKYIYSIYSNIYSYYPVKYDGSYGPETYARALKAMLYTWRYGYTANNLKLSLSAILDAPYTVFGGTVLTMDSDYIYITRGSQYPIEKVGLNGYAPNVKVGDVLNPMVLLTDSLFTVIPYESGTGVLPQSVIDGLAASTLYVNLTSGAIDENQGNFIRNFLDTILPVKYTYVLSTDHVVVEEDIIVG